MPTRMLPGGRELGQAAQGRLNDHLRWGWAQVGSQAETLEWTDWRPITLPGERLSTSCCAQRLGRTSDNTYKERHVPRLSQVGRMKREREQTGRVVAIRLGLI